MASSPTDKPVKDDEEEERTEVNDPAKTSDEEDEVRTDQDEVRTEEDVARTEEVDPAKTTEKEEDKVRTDQDEVRTEEDVARTEEVDPARTTEKAEDEVRTEEEDEPKEEAIKSLVDSARNITEESDQGIENQNRQKDPITTRTSDQPIDLGSTSLTSDQNRRLDNQNPQEQSITTRRSGQAMVERGSTSSARDQNQLLVLPPNPSSTQMSQAMMPPRLGPSVPPHQQDQSVASLQNHPLGLPQPRWLVVDHFYSDGLGLYGEQWRFQTTTPLHPNQNNTYLLHQLIMMELPQEPGPVLVAYNRSFGVLQQDRLVPHVQAPPPMRPPPMMQQQQSPFLSVPPLRPLMPQDEFVVYLGQVPVRPMMYYQEQNQIVPNPAAGIGQQAPVRPPVVTYNQGQIGHSRGQLEAPMWQPPVRMSSPSPIVNAVPVRPMMNYNQQQQQQFNQGQQRFRFPVNMIQHNLPSPSAASAVRPQLHPQAQQPWEWESQGSNDGPSSPGESEG